MTEGLSRVNCADIINSQVKSPRQVLRLLTGSHLIGQQARSRIIGQLFFYFPQCTNTDRLIVGIV